MVLCGPSLPGSGKLKPPPAKAEVADRHIEPATSAPTHAGRDGDTRRDLDDPPALISVGKLKFIEMVLVLV
jgi:hypothetical protein